MRYKVLIITISLVVVLALFFWPSDENKIKDNLASLAEYCSSVKEEPVIHTMQKAAMAAKLCTEPCRVKIEAYDVEDELSQKDLTDRLLMMKKRLPNTVCKFHDTSIKLDGENRAEVIATLHLSGDIGGKDFTDAYEINAITKKINGGWLFSSFNVVEFMEK